jgi:hypothetical protein
MLGRIEFHVDRISIDVDLSEAEAARVTPVIKAALADVAKRLQMAPASRFRDPSRLALSILRVDALPLDELLGPRGATRLADTFWERITASRNGS